MICPKCKNVLPEDSRFCQYCGATLTPVELRADQPEKQEKPKKKVKIWAIVLAAVLILALGFGGVYYGNYRSAINLAEAGDYSGAQAKLMFPAVTNWHDPQLADYLNAGIQYEQGQYYQAKKTFEILSETGYRNSAEMQEMTAYEEALYKLEKEDVAGIKTIMQMAEEGYEPAINNLTRLKADVYGQAIRAYRAGNLNRAKDLFNAITPLSRSKDYLTLIDRKNYKDVFNLIGFEDANEIIVDLFTVSFFEGKWKTRDGVYSFSMSSEGRNSYNLPHEYNTNPYYTVEDGVYFTFGGSAEGQTPTFNSEEEEFRYRLDQLIGRYNRIDLFKFSIINKNTIEVYCYKDGNTYTLYRQT